MKRFLNLLCWTLCCGTGIAGVALAAEPAPKVVDFSADVMRPVKIADSSALSLVGHVVFYHNGAVITCDSAIRFNDRMMDCYNNVIINKDSTFIYGDRAEYNGNFNTARVFSPLVKIVDKDATLYTYNFSFNTLDNIGHYTGGGTMLQKENRLESRDGYYYADNRELIGVHDVEMKNPDYQLKSDSVSYNLDSEIARFYTRSYIWNKDDEFLTALKGSYDRKADLYTFTDQSYILTKTREVWADTILYKQNVQDALLVNNVQVADDEQQAVAFGDLIQYWGKERKALLTRDPVVASFQESDSSKRDTLYMRADSMFVFTYNRDSLLRDSLRRDSLAALESAASDEFTPADGGGTTAATASQSPEGEPQPVAPAETPMSPEDVEAAEKAVTEEEVAEPVLSEKEQKRLAAEKRREAKELERKAKDEQRRAKEKARQERLLLRESRRKGARVGAEADSAARADSLAHAQLLQAQRDSLAKLAQQEADTLLPAPADSVEGEQDSLVRKMFAYHNVRIFRDDFQAVCDSMTGFSLDSTLHMYVDPVLWNDNNQVTSKVVDIYTLNQKIDRAVFTGEPIMSQEVDTSHYNQIKGKVIESFFRDGTIYRTDVNGNGQTYYFMVEEDSTGNYISGFMTVECADISFYFKDQAVDEIVWRGKPVYSIYPMDKIPDSQPLTLPGFVWEGKRRPSKEQVFNRTFRPSERNEYDKLPRPEFPITQKINLAREQLVKENVWFDRNDPLSSEALEFIRSIGY
ncbi:OstA-like protein [Alistipes indistinctus]|uniref:OstA-like protein n=1 Tax=Alistipes indistinctus TaxID=626932 RepID=UPI0026DC14A0|nr:OstA-like protein [Alistipes indistinctus]